jgi:drug/metabolite transporter (DMT)-like permease
MFSSWIFYCIVFIVLQVAFLQLFKHLAGKSKDIGSLTVIVQITAALCALALSPLEEWTWPSKWEVWLLLGFALLFYAGADRLNAIARKNMEISTETMLHQAWKLLFFFTGIIFLGRGFTVLKLLGGIIIVLANISLFFEKRKFKFNKYALLKIIGILCFTGAMTLDVNNSAHFNLPFYVFISFGAPAVLLFLTGQAKPRKLWAEIKNTNFWLLIACAIANGFGAVAILRAYELEYFMSAAISSIYVVLNVAFAYIFLKERTHLVWKLIAAAIIVGGIVMVTFG